MKISVPKPRKTSSGKSFIQLRITQDDGKRKSIPVTADNDDLCIAKAMAIREGLLKVKNNPLVRTLGEAYDSYIEENQEDWSASTVAGYRRLRKNTFQSIMDRPLSSLSNQAINREIKKMDRAGLSYKYIVNAVGLLRPVLKDYYKDFELEIELPKKKKKKASAPMPNGEDIAELMRISKGTEVELPILMAVWMGMRMSEIRGAIWSDIKNGRLHIQQVIVDDYDGNPVEQDTTKTESGDRWVPIPQYIMNLIPENLAPEDHLVTLSGQAIYKRYIRLLEKAGLPHFRFHDLRHANAAVMIALGIDSRYAQERNGWASDYMYKQVYGYVMSEKMQAESIRIDNYFDAIASGLANKVANKN